MRNPKSALFVSEIRAVRYPSKFCTNHHKIDMISLARLKIPIQKKTVLVEYSMLHTHTYYSGLFVGTRDSEQGTNIHVPT